MHFRCMVQDMYDSEFFFKVYNISNIDNGCSFLRCGLYQDIIQHKVRFIPFLHHYKSLHVIGNWMKVYFILLMTIDDDDPVLMAGQ